MISPAATAYCEVNSNCLNTPLDSVMSLAFLGLLVIFVWLTLIGIESLILYISRRRRSLQSLSVRPLETVDEYVKRVI